MTFRIRGLDEGQFRHLFGRTPEELSEYGVQRMIVDSKPGFPCRVSLQDADVGDTVLLMNYEHQPALSPYRSSHAIFVREWAGNADVAKDEIPDVLRSRQISARAFDAEGMMLEADVVDGGQLDECIDRMFANEAAAYIHLHNAQRGCYAARVERA